MAKNLDFENGRKVQKLEQQIRALNTEINFRSGKNNPYQTELLRKIVKNVWNEYSILVKQYPDENINTLILEKIYYKALGENKETISKKSEELKSLDDISFW